MRDSEPPRSFRPIRWWAAIPVVVLVLCFMAGAYLWLSGATAGSTAAARIQVEVIRTVLTVGAGTGGAAALLLAYRRQWLQEHDQEHRELVDRLDRRHREEIVRLDQRHRERVADDARFDATERRITELYVQAVEQLGSDPAPVRLAGLYGLERLGSTNSRQRQTIVDVICAYLRMPYTPPVKRRPDSADLAEQQVRRVAQRILTSHLRPYSSLGLKPETSTSFWKDMRIDLSGAHLEEFDMSRCRVLSADFIGTTFHGDAWFTEAVFETSVDFQAAVFTGDGRFEHAVADMTWFSHAKFLHKAHFAHARFSGPTQFHSTEFKADASFRSVRFQASTAFIDTTFEMRAEFPDASFHRDTHFTETRFRGAADFQDTVFGESADIIGTDFADTARFDRAVFNGPVDVIATSFHNGVSFDGAVFDDEVSTKDAKVHKEFTPPASPGDWRLVPDISRAGGGFLQAGTPDDSYTPTG